MINFILNTIFAVMNFLIGLFPSSEGFPVEFGNAFKAVGGALYTLDPLIPIAQLGTCVAIVLGVEFAYWAFKALTRVFSHVPAIGGKGNK